MRNVSRSVLLCLLFFICSFNVVSQSVSSLAPSSGTPGQALDIVIRGLNTHFKNGYSIAAFGTGINVLKFTVQDEFTGIATININSAASAGLRNEGSAEAPLKAFRELKTISKI
jgi:hypothetical protein